VIVRFTAKILLLPVVMGLGACSMPDMDSFKAPDSSTFFRPLSVTGMKEKQLPPVTAEQMVDASGRCAAGAMAAQPAASQPNAQASAGQPGGLPPQDDASMLMPGGIALGMTECDVVAHAGTPERVEIGTGERNERTATLTYIHGQRPGIYHFSAGRLKSMERAPEPAVAAKPEKKKRAKPARRTATQPSQVTVQ
jgi:hypothetical protein